MKNKKVLSVYLDDDAQKQLKFLEYQTGIPQAAHIRNSLNAYYAMIRKYGAGYILDVASMDQETYIKYYGRTMNTPDVQLIIKADKDGAAPKQAVQRKISSPD
jgi:hypothetical protein